MTKKSYILGAIILVIVVVAGVFLLAGNKASAPATSALPADQNQQASSPEASSTAPAAPVSASVQSSAPVSVHVAPIKKPVPPPAPALTVTNDFPPQLFFDTAFVDGTTTYFSVSIVGGPQNKNVSAWGLKVFCPAGVSVYDKQGVSYCGTSHSVLPSTGYDSTRNLLFLSAAANNSTGGPSNAGFNLSAFDAAGNQIGTTTGTLNLRAPAPATSPAATSTSAAQ